MDTPDLSAILAMPDSLPFIVMAGPAAGVAAAILFSALVNWMVR
jgi:hypothetical protein